MSTLHPAKHRLRLVATLAAAFSSALMLLVAGAPSAEAVVNGGTDSSTKPWTVYIKTPGNGVCSGSLLAEQWVLTASHCVRKGGRGDVLPASAFTVLLGKSSSSDVGGAIRSVDRTPSALPLRWDARAQQWVNDLALLHLISLVPSSLSPLALQPSASAVAPGTAVTFVGWGGTENTPGGRFMRSTRAGDWTFVQTCSGPGNVCYAPRRGVVSRPVAGDSGAPVVASVRGGWVQVGAFTGPGPVTNPPPTQYGTSTVAQLGWIRRTVGLPIVGPNVIVRDPGTGTSWLTDGDGFRHWIENGTTFNCLTGRGVVVSNMSRFQALSLPEDTTSRAQCSTPNPPAPVPAPAPVFPVMNTSETPPDGVWFRNGPASANTDRVTGHGVYSGDRIEVKCFVWGEAVGRYGNRVWYLGRNITRPTVPGSGVVNGGFLNSHYVDDGLLANQVDGRVPGC